MDCMSWDEDQSFPAIKKISWYQRLDLDAPFQEKKNHPVYCRKVTHEATLKLRSSGKSAGDIVKPQPQLLATK